MVNQEKLVIYLPDNDQHAPWWATQSAVHKGKVDTLAAAAKDRKVIVIVPAEEIILRSVQLPRMSHARLIQALPFALEEELIGDIDELHFAIGGRQSDGRLPVAIVRKQKMQEWCQQLQAWHVQPDQMIPAIFVLPHQANTWQIWMTETSTVRTDSYDGFAIENANVAAFVKQALLEAKTFPQALHLYNTTSHAYKAELAADALVVEEQFISTEQMLQQVMQWLDIDKNINLLQGGFAIKKPMFSKLQVKWKVAAYLGAVCLALLILYPMVSYVVLKTHLISLRNQMTAIYKQHFPQATSLAAAKPRLQDKLEGVTAELGQNRLLLLLGYVAKGIKDVPSIKVKRFDFQHDQLTLDLSAATSEDLSTLTDYLQQQGLAVKEQSTDVVGSRLQARMVVE